MTVSTNARLERAIVVGLPVVVALILLRAVGQDPAHGVTFSNAPFSDEGWRAVNARNLVFFGSWATDDWAMHLFQLPVSVAQAIIFSVAGVGLVQARLVSVGATVAMAAILLIGLRRPLGLPGAVAVSIAVATSALTLRSNDGIVALAWPLIGGAMVSLVILVRDGRGTRLRPGSTMSGPARVALVGSLWTIAGLLAFGSFDYQPDRYVVPLLPGLALIVGAGVARLAEQRRPRGGPTRVALFVAILAVLAGPGILTDLGWSAGSGRRALDGQAAVQTIVPDGAIAVGPYASVFALTTRARAMVTYPNTAVNAGDAYASGARWVFTADGAAPAWVDQHRAAWAERRLRWCTDWGQPLAQVCLFELP